MTSLLKEGLGSFVNEPGEEAREVGTSWHEAQSSLRVRSNLLLVAWKIL